MKGELEAEDEEQQGEEEEEEGFCWDPFLRVASRGE